MDAYPDVVFLDIAGGVYKDKSIYEDYYWYVYFAVSVYVDDPDVFESRLIEPEGTVDSDLLFADKRNARWGYFTSRPTEARSDDIDWDHFANYQLGM